MLRLLLESSRIRQTNSQLYIYIYIYIYIYACLLPSEVSLQLKNLLKNIYKSKCHEDETETIFKSPCLFTLNALIQFKQPMLVYFECFHLLQIAHACLRRIFNTGVSIYPSHITIFTFATLYCKNILFSIIFRG